MIPESDKRILIDQLHSAEREKNLYAKARGYAAMIESAKELAAVSNRTMGQVVSELIRKALEPARVGRVRNGVPLLPRRTAGAARPTMKLVNSLRDEP